MKKIRIEQIDGLTSAIDDLTSTIDMAVSYTPQTLTDEQKEQARANILSSPLLGFRFGGVLSNNATDITNDIDVSPFTLADESGQYVLSSEIVITKRVDAIWSPGSGNGGLDTGSVAPGFYSFWAIGGESVPTDVLISASWNMPTMPPGYTRKRYLGRMGYSSGWYTFKQVGNHFRRRSMAAAPVTTTLALNTPTMITLPAAPSGAEFLLDLQWRTLNTGAASLAFINCPNDAVLSTISSPLDTNVGGAAGVSTVGKLQVYSDAIQRVRAIAINADTTLDLRVAGWWDPYL